MPDSRLNHTGKSAKRNLPAWNSGEPKSKPIKRKHNDDTSAAPVQAKDDDSQSCSHNDVTINLEFSKLLEGVVFALSGYVNPERSTLRSQALDMGAEYSPDWTSDCTLLVCNYAQTPKFRQVQFEGGTIVAKEWITTCYNQRKLVDIELYLMNVGKPWRRQKEEPHISRDKENQSSNAHQRNIGRLDSKFMPSSGHKGKHLSDIRQHFSSGKIKQWALDDLQRTVKWLECQDEKPEQDKLKETAAEGMRLCLQDALQSLLAHNDGIRLVMEQWEIVPRVIKELGQLKNEDDALSKEDLSELLIEFKKVYELVLDNSDSGSKIGKPEITGSQRRKPMQVGTSSAASHDSDETIEMTEEELCAESLAKDESSNYPTLKRTGVQGNDNAASYDSDKTIELTEEEISEFQKGQPEC